MMWALPSLQASQHVVTISLLLLECFFRNCGLDRLVFSNSSILCHPSSCSSGQINMPFFNHWYILPLLYLVHARRWYKSCINTIKQGLYSGLLCMHIALIVLHTCCSYLLEQSLHCVVSLTFSLPSVLSLKLSSHLEVSFHLHWAVSSTFSLSLCYWVFRAPEYFHLPFDIQFLRLLQSVLAFKLQC